MKVKPLHDWAVIRPSEPAEKTAGGLYIPDAARDKPQEGVVEAIGPGALEEEKRQKKKSEKKERHFVPTSVKPGDRVVYGRYAGQTYNVNGEELVLVRERDILGILPAPLQIPSATASARETALMKSAAKVPPERAGAKKTAAKKQKKTVRKETKGKPQAAKTEKAAKKAAKKQGLKKKASAKPAKAKTAQRAKAKKAGKKK